MIDKIILAATNVSRNNPDSMAALALIELSLAELRGPHSQNELIKLVDKWRMTLQGVDPLVRDRLTDELTAAGSPTDTLDAPLRQAS